MFIYLFICLLSKNKIECNSTKKFKVTIINEEKIVITIHLILLKYGLKNLVQGFDKEVEEK